MSLSERVLESELMDDPALASDKHARALRGLRRVNFFSGTSEILARSIRPLLRSAKEEIRVLDLACGGGDVTLQLARKLTEQGWKAEVVGWDRSATAIEIAESSRVQAEVPNVRFEVQDVLADSKPMVNQDGAAFDVIVSTLFLHHLTIEDSERLFSRMFRSAKRMVLIDDLRRTWFGLCLAHIACRVLTRSPIVRVDGPMSVRAAFHEREVEAIADKAGIPRPTIRRHWPQRFLLQWNL